ncbi:nucleotide sugar dehydrogenase [Emticicia oligotrophica DSM 17448]|uniref:Nucleotide sugar dehydrogenase n=1 Tax=Emticicia oligotrophica (strain DSM 17448 / CIP 109782 / MTCC 6937 / GPTSA100-15) TaxID=929562 RepID=A0ABN4AMN2_EMTOG|nr:nucleotide sugar dehydrogenase [Emticicia oligotrophica]AFK02920.1 nucleotide sugar dehydrogenase [Emticicia oligotrophica DSM 17448]
MEEISNYLSENTIAVIGLGNVGLPLATEFSKKFTTIGFDIDSRKIASLSDSHSNENLSFTDTINNISHCNIYIIAVATFVTESYEPQLDALKAATTAVAKILKTGDLVIFESTVYAGCTEEVCVPILEKSGLTFNKDFSVGYSPERINTADNLHVLSNTIKITSGSTPEVAQRVDQLYRSIVNVGTYLAPSIKVAEASKILENAQRDINIAFINNVAVILTEKNIPFDEVWKASSTKWNFMKFSTGLVGGDCLPLASSYINFLSLEKNNILSAAREINDSMPSKIASIIKQKLPNENLRVLILGISYKPNTPSIKGSLVPNLIHELQEKFLKVDVFDPFAEPNDLITVDYFDEKTQPYACVIKAVNHRIFENLNYNDFCDNNTLVFDISTFSFKKHLHK